MVWVQAVKGLWRVVCGGVVIVQHANQRLMNDTVNLARGCRAMREPRVYLLLESTRACSGLSCYTSSTQSDCGYDDVLKSTVSDVMCGIIGGVIK